LIDLVVGKPPWPGKKDKTKCVRRKKRLGPVELCKRLPEEFIGIIEEIYALGFDEKPRYRRIKRKMRKVIEELGGMDAPYDWEMENSQEDEKTEVGLSDVEEEKAAGEEVEREEVASAKVGVEVVEPFVVESEEKVVLDVNKAENEKVIDRPVESVTTKVRGRRQIRRDDHDEEAGCVGCSVA
jgi:hypothetical protein